MIRKFECKNCKFQFEADDQENVVCPHCQSDNVDYVKFNIPSKVYKIGGCVIVLLAVIIALFQIDWGTNTEDVGTGGPTICPPPPDVNGSGKEVFVIPPTVEVEDLSFIDNGYKFKVIVKNRPSGNTYLAIINPINNKIIGKSDDGEFKGIPYSQADGSYYTIALMNTSDSILTSIDKPGFIKQVSVSTKMTVEELQKKMDSRDESLLGSGENDYLAPDYKLKFVGLPSDAVNIPKILSEVFEKIDMEVWQSATVTSLEYDDMNRVNKITIKIVVSNDNF